MKFVWHVIFGVIENVDTLQAELVQHRDAVVKTALLLGLDLLGEVLPGPVLLLCIWIVSVLLGKESQ